MSDILLISVDNTRDQHAESDLVNSINSIAQVVGPKLKGKPFLIFSPKQECVDCAEVLDSTLRFVNYMVIENFHTDTTKYKAHPFVSKRGISGLTLKPNFFDNNYNELFNTIQMDCEEGSVVLIVDEEWSDRLKEFCRTTKTFGHAKLSSFSRNMPAEPVGNLVPQGVPRGAAGNDKEIFFKFQNNLIPEFRREIRQIRHEQLTRIEGALGSSANTMEGIESSVRNLYTSAPTGSGDISSMDIDVIEKGIKEQKELIERIKEELDQSEEIANTYTDTNQLDQVSKITIDKFFYEKDINAWRIRVSNLTGVNFHNVDIYKVETKDKICSFAIVQANCQLWKTIPMDYSEDFYGLHLLAMSQDTVITEEPFLVSYFKIKNGTPNWETNEIEFTLKNYSETVFQMVNITVSGTIIDIGLDCSEIKYKEQIAGTIPFDKFTNCKVFAYSDNRKVTSDLMLWFGDEEV